MISKQFISFATATLSLLSVTEQALGRYRWLERDDRPVFLHPRRFGQENPEVLTQLGQACDGQVCGVLAGQAVSTLLAAAGECDQQDMADQIIDAAQQFDETTKENMISLAVEFRQAEKNTPPDFTTNPATNRNSVFCQKAPSNTELNGLVQAQDPANDPNIFFDPAVGGSVTLGSQPNTFPFGTSGSTSDSGSGNSTVSAVDDSAGPTAVSVAARDSTDDDTDCDTSPVIVTVAGSQDEASTTTGTDVSDSCSTVTVTVGADGTSTTDPEATSSASTTGSSSDIGDFGSCSVPEIEFGTGFDGRKETSFEPADKTSYNHGSAQAIGIITQFICDTLTNSCGADQTAKDTCATAQQAADAQTAKTGAQADAFNAAFGITTNFASVAEVDDQGNVVVGTRSGDTSSDSTSSSDGTASDSSTASSDSTTSASDAAPTDSGAAGTDDGTDSSGTTTASNSSSDIGDFGSCSVPEIEFGTGFDGRKETSFEPVDKTSFNHGSAQAIGIITQFICDTLTNSCGADQTAKDTCATAQDAANAQTAKTGAQADAFNAAFGITTNFASVAEVDDQGNVVGDTSSGTSNASNADNNVASSTTAAASSTAVASSTDSTTDTNGATTDGSTDTGSGGNLQTFSGNLGASAPAVTALSNGEFQVDGNDSFQNLQSALVRSCDVQHNQCANAANSSGNQGDLTVAACDQQDQECAAQAQSA